MTDQLLDALLAMVELAVILSLGWKGMLPPAALFALHAASRYPAV